MAQAGTVKWFNDAKGYGFIQPPAGPDIYVHHSEIEMDGYRTLRPGMAVEFELETGPLGPQARKVNLRG